MTIQTPIKHTVAQSKIHCYLLGVARGSTTDNPYFAAEALRLAGLVGNGRFGEARAYYDNHAGFHCELLSKLFDEWLFSR